MKSKNAMLFVSIMFFVLAVALSLAVWKDASLAAKIAFFALGFGSGISAGNWVARRNK